VVISVKGFGLEEEEEDFGFQGLGFSY
jgi:hypothetical protein